MKKLKKKIFLFSGKNLDGVRCVGGRFANGKFNDEAKDQRLVSQQKKLARLIILDSHHCYIASWAKSNFGSCQN